MKFNLYPLITKLLPADTILAWQAASGRVRQIAMSAFRNYGSITDSEHAVIQNATGTRSQHASYTGSLGEITVDTSKKTAVVHDAVTVGGNPLARQFDANIKEYGAVGDGVVDDRAAIQAAIDSGVGGIIIPDGTFRLNGPLNFTGSNPGFRITGGGLKSKLMCYGASKCFLDFTGSVNCILSNFWIEGDAINQPDAAILFSRNATNGTSGIHRVYNVRTAGRWAKSALVSLSSEANSYIGCNFENISTTNGTRAIAIISQNTIGVSSDFSTFPGTFIGGNTVHQFTNCIIGATGNATAVDAVLEEIRDIAFTSCFFSNGIGTGMTLKDCSNVFIHGSAEWGGSYGFRVLVGNGIAPSLYNAVITGHWGVGFYADDTTNIRNCEFRGTFSNIPGINVYNIQDSIICNRGLGVTVRNQSHAVHYDGGSENTSSSFSFPSDFNGNRFEHAETGAGTKRYYLEDGNDTKGRHLAHIHKSKLRQTVVQTPAYAATLVPVTDNGGTIVVGTLTGGIFVDAPNTGNFNAGLATEGYGLEVTFVFKQDAIGGRAIAFETAVWKANWTPDTAANKINTITFRETALGWVQIASATGI